MRKLPTSIYNYKGQFQVKFEAWSHQKGKLVCLSLGAYRCLNDAISIRDKIKGIAGPNLESKKKVHRSDLIDITNEFRIEKGLKPLKNKK